MVVWGFCFGFFFFSFDFFASLFNHQSGSDSGGGGLALLSQRQCLLPFNQTASCPFFFHHFRLPLLKFDLIASLISSSQLSFFLIVSVCLPSASLELLTAFQLFFNREKNTRSSCKYLNFSYYFVVAVAAAAAIVHSCCHTEGRGKETLATFFDIDWTAKKWNGQLKRTVKVEKKKGATFIAAAVFSSFHFLIFGLFQLQQLTFQCLLFITLTTFIWPFPHLPGYRLMLPLALSRWCDFPLIWCYIYLLPSACRRLLSRPGNWLWTCQLLLLLSGIK